MTKAQSRYLKKRKEELEDSVLFLGDFAENFKFVVQDEVQSFHWNNHQASLHPVVIYYKGNDSVQHTSYCIISDDTAHDVAFVYEVQKHVIQYMKMKLKNIKKNRIFHR